MQEHHPPQYKPQACLAPFEQAQLWPAGKRLARDIRFLITHAYDKRADGGQLKPKRCGDREIGICIRLPW
jgi:hypothetical protein